MRYIVLCALLKIHIIVHIELKWSHDVIRKIYCLILLLFLSLNRPNIYKTNEGKRQNEKKESSAFCIA